MRYLRYIFILLLLTITVFRSAYANNNASIALSRASEFLIEINFSFNTENLIQSSEYIEIVDQGKVLAYVFNLKPQGFIIVSEFDVPSSIIGFSVDDSFPIGQDLITSPVFAVVKGIALSKKMNKSKVNVKEPLTSPNGTKEELYGPYVYTLWGQVNCHNNQGQLINVTNYYTPNHYAVGCVAISLSTLLHYYKWPPVGEGYHQYNDGWGSSTGWYEANFGETYYKWDLMLNKYNNQVSTEPQREAAGELAFQAAVALEMNFEYNGSTANVNDIPGIGSDYFRFYSFYKQENSTVFWPRLDLNMVEANPVILSVENNSGYGHSVVCDGLWLTDDEERFYHLNMGWWGSGNGWFTIQDNFNASGYTTINGGILDFIPKPYLHGVEISADTNMFHLTWQFTQTISADAYEIQHKINSGSWETITDDYQETSILIVLDNVMDDHRFRVKAKVNDEWYPSSWSNTVQLQIITSIIETASKNLVNIYPNPFINKLKISLNEDIQDLSIRILNMLGEQVYQSDKKYPSNELEINAMSWGKGIYLIEAEVGGTQQVFKIIKK